MTHRDCRLRCLLLLLALAWVGQISAARAAEDLAERLRAVDSRVFPAGSEQARSLPGMLGQDVRARLRAADARESKAWRALKGREDWEKYRDVRLRALRESLGTFPPVPADLRVRVTRTLEGPGYRIDNLVFESRPGLLVTANLYRPAEPPGAMPGILICHSHHNPKTQSELQDMGVLWARAGCLVLVMDQLGHGERRQHPFSDARSFQGTFRPSRQDYYFRYNAGLQLYAIGDSLMSWMVWDLMRGVDLLLSRPGIDRERIILLGAVAGGGDPAAVTAALDRRIAAVAPFNFGGPQPETTFPLPANAEDSFRYTGSGSWESTRNLRLSARDGFLPWVIVGAAAPRRLIYSHEFAWDRDHDPVWRRLETIYRWYDVPDRLAETHGRGKVTGKPPEATHCNNIGSLHRQGIYPALKKWFGIAPPDREPQERHSAEELTALTPALAREMKARPLHELAATLGEERAEAARRRLAVLQPAARREQLRRDWARLLGDVAPHGEAKVIASHKERLGDVTVERLAFEVEPGIVVPVLLLLPPSKSGERLPLVVAVAQAGKRGFLEERAADLAGLLNGGVAVCLPDVRGTGETRPGDGRGRSSSAAALAASEWMLGQTLVGARLRDLRSLLAHLRKRDDLDAGRVLVWGDSFAPANAPERNLAVPLDAEKLPEQAEPLGGLLALLAGLYEDDVRAVLVRGGLASYQSLLQGPFLYVPADCMVPGVLTVGDLADVAGTLVPRPLRLEGLVDGLNRRVTGEALDRSLAPARAAYRAAGQLDRLRLETDASAPGWRWLLEQARKGG
jgi:cephalosporin-C deacetylase-like acetyl esterase